MVLFGLTVAFSINVPMFSTLRFFEGFCLAGITLSLYVLRIELCLPFWRFRVTMVANFVVLAGQLLMPGLAALCKDWQVLQAIIICPFILMVSYFWIFPESLRWLLSTQQYFRARRHMHRVARKNQVCETATDELFSEIQRESEKKPKKTCIVKVVGTRNLWKNIVVLCVNSLTGYGIHHCFARSMIDQEAGETSMFHNFHADYYTMAGIAVASCMALCPAVGFMGRKGCLLMFMIITALASLLQLGLLTLLGKYSMKLNIEQEQSETLNKKFSIAFSIIGMFSSHAVSNLSIFFCAEITPTVIRGGGLGLVLASAGFGMLTAPIMELHNQKGYFLHHIIFACCTLICIICILLLPETRYKPLPEFIGDGDRPPSAPLTAPKKVSEQDPLLYRPPEQETALQGTEAVEGPSTSLADAPPPAATQAPPPCVIEITPLCTTGAPPPFEVDTVCPVAMGNAHPKIADTIPPTPIDNTPSTPDTTAPSPPVTSETTPTTPPLTSETTPTTPPLTTETTPTTPPLTTETTPTTPPVTTETTPTTPPVTTETTPTTPPVTTGTTPTIPPFTTETTPTTPPFTTEATPIAPSNTETVTMPPCAKEASSPTATDPKSPTATDPKSPTATDPKSPTATDPKSPSPTDPKTPTATDHKSPTATDPKSPTATDPKSPTATDPKSPSPTDPKTPTATDHKSPTATDPKSPTATDPISPTATDTKSPTDTDPKTPTATDPKSPATTDSKSPTATDLRSPTATDLKSPTATDLKSPTGTDPKSPTATDPISPSATDTKSPTDTDPKTLTATDPKSPTDTDPKSPSDTDPISPSAIDVVLPGATDSPTTPPANGTTTASTVGTGPANGSANGVRSS
ncbi:mucin-2-like isoform X2 [Conger conger]|nr:mucin-2-like isoform X2 [Conger conger]